MAKKEIDFVITWVDGSDPVWMKEKTKYENSSGILETGNGDAVNGDTREGENKAHEERYRDWDNLRYWFRAVEKYAPFVRKIHFVTFGHVPEWLDTENEKIHIVKHEDFIPEKYLPTFNSHAIELNLHRIDGLSEQFVYFNDDTFLNQPVSEEFFFKDGLPTDVFGLDLICFSSDSAGMYNANNLTIINDHFSLSDDFKKNAKKWNSPKSGIKIYIKNKMLSYRGFYPGFFYQHLPNNYLKSTFETVWEKEEATLDKTCRCRFREDTNVNQWVMKYWQLASGNYMPRKKDVGRCFQIKDATYHAVDAILNGKDKLLCINDTAQTVDFEKRKEEIIQAFSKKYPEKSSFEL